MKVVLTGGHLSPAISVIENAPEDWQVFFIGRKNSFEGDKSPSLEYQIIKSLNIPFINLPSARFQRKFTIHTLPSLVKVPYALIISIASLRKIRPDVVLGFGGYVSLPVCFAASMLNIPVVIHEQTLEAGLANKIIAKWARMVCISWKNSIEFFPNRRVILTGNPIRKEIVEGKDSGAISKIPTIYITGGSAGSHFINTLVEGSIEKLVNKYRVIHQTGDSKKYNDFQRLSEKRDSLPKDLRERYIIKKFVGNDEISSTLQQSWLVVGRAGVNTMTELIFLQKPVILIPIPFSQGNEQFKNATFIKNLGLAEILEQDKTDAAGFTAKINEMINNILKYTLPPGCGNIVEKKAAEHIISAVEDVAKKKE